MNVFKLYAISVFGELMSWFKILLDTISERSI